MVINLNQINDTRTSIPCHITGCKCRQILSRCIIPLLKFVLQAVSMPFATTRIKSFEFSIHTVHFIPVSIVQQMEFTFSFLFDLWLQLLLFLGILVSRF